MLIFLKVQYDDLPEDVYFTIDFSGTSLKQP